MLMKEQRTLELLAPARDLACAMAAVDHGADAIYIGASDFGARVAAGNSVDDIRQLCDYAHRYGVRVYVTVNTLIYEDEIDKAYQLMKQLAEAKVDALLVQDMAAIELIARVRKELGYAPALHASTQCDTRSAKKVKWLQAQGFSRAVLARELSLDEIKAIHKAVPTVELEGFVHGALCVSYSGVCYASQYCFGRSANRGACAQFCRMKFDLLDADGCTIEHDRHLLSLKDMNRLDHLEELADAGICSFKIEGRLKTADYVKNVVSAYSRKLDDLVRRRPDDYRRASLGKVSYGFTPDLKKTFNRGFTTYFLNGRQPDIASFDTPKALGEMVGHVKELRRDSFTVAGIAAFANGDGLCFLNDEHELEGFRVNRVEGGRLFPFRMPAHLRKGMTLYRNQDVAFEKLLNGKTADRRIPVSVVYGLTQDGFRVTMSIVGKCAEVKNLQAEASVVFDHQAAKRPQTDNIRQQLAKLGTTAFHCEPADITIEQGADGLFIPSSLLSELRREAAESLQKKIIEATEQKQVLSTKNAVGQESAETNGEEGDRKGTEQAECNVNFEQPQDLYDTYSYLYNVANHLSRQFYERQGIKVEAPVFELKEPGKALVMQCRHCLRYALGHCVKRGGTAPRWRELLTLRLGDGRRFRLEFRCDLCQMNIYAE